ncbi:MAG TPA: Asp-tRNA(Asn)/Glu-tRNA(Gln) amidotransferase GatCAB subunit C [Candidatus Yonathbacteria bacterium]|nr:Asp-tRNA(Asn)/Glu-tRNA(Gln) amidotransferase GatCAB subunit C [Candidatus Yonathbacteria bacterium]
MAIELKDVEHLAGLARIAISNEEKKILQHDLEEILAYVSQVTKVTAEFGAPTVGELHNVMREDTEPHAGGMFTEDILNQAPAREGNRISVKKIL